MLFPASEIFPTLASTSMAPTLPGWVRSISIRLSHHRSHTVPSLAGWPDNLAPTADILSKIYKDAQALNPKAKVRGVSTNVRYIFPCKFWVMIPRVNSRLTPYSSNYNGLGNQDQQGYDELKYVSNLAPLLTAGGFPAHFIVVSSALHPNPDLAYEGDLLGPRKVW